MENDALENSVTSNLENLVLLYLPLRAVSGCAPDKTVCFFFVSS